MKTLHLESNADWFNDCMLWKDDLSLR